MPEREKKPQQSQELVPLNESERPLFDLSAKQRQIAERYAFSYIKKNKLLFNSDNLSTVTELLIGDALPRGLTVLDKKGITPQDNIKEIFDTGMNQRAHVIKSAGSILEQYRYHITNVSEGNTPRGEYAIPWNHLQKAQREQRNAFITPSLIESEKLIRTVTLRKKLLPILADDALSTLPKDQYTQASLDLFPDSSDQAKIARNMLTSFAFRGNPFPSLTIENVRTFAYNPHIDQDNLFQLIERYSESIEERFEIPTSDTTSYLKDLLTQTLLPFQNIGPYLQEPSGMDEQELIRTRDAFFNRFSKTLLLLHPALEEQEFITDQSRFEGNEYSLWGDRFSQKIKGVRIPTTEALQRAERINQAKNKSFSRFSRGIEAWKQYNRLEKGKERTTTRLEQDILETTHTIQQYKSFQEMPVPSTAIEMVKREHPQEYGRYQIDSHAFSITRQRISRAKNLRNKIQEYDHQLREQYPDSLPDEIPLARWMQESLESAQRSRITFSEHLYYSALNSASETFVHDYFYKKTSSKYPDFENQSSEEITATLGMLTEERTRVNNIKSDIVTSADSSDNLQSISTFIQNELDEIQEEILFVRQLQIEGEKGVKVSEISLRRMRTLLIQQREVTELLSRFGADVRGIPKSFYRHSLDERISTLSRVLATRKNLSDKEQALPPIPNTIPREEYEAIKRKNTIQSYYIEPEQENEIKAEFNRISGFIQTLLHPNRLTASEFWPGTITTREEFRTFLEGRIARIDEKWEKEIQKHTKRVEKLQYTPTALKQEQEHYERMFQNRLRTQESIRSFLAVIDSPLLPVEEAQGMKGSEFRLLLKRRMSHIKAQLDYSRLESAFHKSSQRIEELKREEYIKSQEQKKTRLEAELEEIKNSDPQDYLLQEMQRLELAYS